jgi:hypothetical protein
MPDQVFLTDQEVCQLLRKNSPWTPPALSPDIPYGDMPGDKVHINESHIAKANVIFPRLLGLLAPILEANPYRRAVVTVCGGSGVGKSETASLLTFYLNSLGIGSYTLSGDNYPHRIPKYNDAERLRIFRHCGIRGLLTSGLYTSDRTSILKSLQLSGEDADPARNDEYPWLAVYQKEGRCGLKRYLGTENELDFQELTGIVSDFKNGADSIWLKRMGRDETALWYDCVDFREVRVLIIEWTHGNSDGYQGVDIPILLSSTPQETRAYRKSRNRDGNTDSPFTTMVLEIEQELLTSQASKAKIIVNKNGDIIGYEDYFRLMLLSQTERTEAGR